MNIQPPRIGPQPWPQVRTRLDQQLPFANMRDTPYYRDAVYEQFSASEYARRYAALRGKMREHKLDCMIVPGGPSHWSFGGGMLWLTGHWEWHALASYVLVPLEGEPTMIYSMGGTHAEAGRRQVEVAVKDVRHSRTGRYADVMVERIRELELERSRIGLMEIDPRHGDYLPVNQYNVLRDNLPDAELVFTKGFLHELVSIHSAEELDCVRTAGLLCQNAMAAMVERALVFGNPRPSGRVLAKGDIVNMELAAGYRGYTAQIGSPICLGEPTDMVRRFWDDITLPGYRRIIAEMQPGKPMEDMRLASQFFRESGVQSRPTQCHGIDLVTDKPHISAEHVSAEDFETVLKPGMVIMAEPNPITADGLFGIFLGHTFIITPDGPECVDEFPLEIAVAKC